MKQFAFCYFMVDDNIGNDLNLICEFCLLRLSFFKLIQVSVLYFSCRQPMRISATELTIGSMFMIVVA